MNPISLENMLTYLKVKALKKLQVQPFLSSTEIPD